MSCFGPRLLRPRSARPRWLAKTWKQICMALLLLRPLRWLRQRGARHSLSSLQGKPVPLPEPTSLGSGSTLPLQPQYHNHEAHPRKKNCRTRARRGRRSHLRIFQQHPLNTRGRQSWCSRVQRSGCRRLTRDRHRCCVSQKRRHRCCESVPPPSQRLFRPRRLLRPRRQHQRKEDPLI